MNGALNKRISFEQRKRGFRFFTAAQEFVRGWDAYHAYDFRGALAAFKRVAEIDPQNPYAWAYLLFAMEDSADYTIQQLADVAAQWHDCAVKFKYHGLDALSIIWFIEYIKMLHPVENGVSWVKYKYQCVSIILYVIGYSRRCPERFFYRAERYI